MIDEFKLRMYFLDRKMVPSDSKMTESQVLCLAITMNMVLKNFESFECYKGAFPNVQHEFQQGYFRNFGFFVNANSTLKPDSRRPASTGYVGFLFFRMLHELWVDVSHNGRGGGNGMIVSGVGDIYDPNSRDTCYANLVMEKNSVTNEEIVDFCAMCATSAFFTATAFGFKNKFPNPPSGYINLQDPKEGVVFARKATHHIANSVKDLLNSDDLPDALCGEIFRHDLCPIIYTFDVGQEVKPIAENCSLLSGGFSGKSYMSQCFSVTKQAMIHDDIANFLTGACNILSMLASGKPFYLF